MQEIEVSHCNAVINAVTTACYAFFSAQVKDILGNSLAYGKIDTLRMDALPEITMIEMLKRYDRHALVITEESKLQQGLIFGYSDNSENFRTIFISDPTDRSAQLQSFLEKVTDKSRKVGDVLRDEETSKRWEENHGTPVQITGASSSVTCVRRGIPIFSVMVNYITQELIVVCSAGSYIMSLPKYMTEIDLNQVKAKGTKITFRTIDSQDLNVAKRFVTFTGKKGYKENLTDSKLMSEGEIESHLHYNLPGGALRILYLSTLQPEDKSIGFILANGEKIGEWIHWLPFIQFARKLEDQSQPALLNFEIYQERPWTKEGILMATSPAYSILRPHSPNSSEMIIDVPRFGVYSNPSQVRCTLLVTPSCNMWATQLVKQHGYRPIQFYSE